MPVPTDADSFLELARKSGVIDRARLDAYITQKRAEGPLPEQPKAVANLLVRDGLLTRFQARYLVAGKWRGFILGKYKALEPLGSGGMSTVYLAEHMLMKRRVAIKVLPLDKSRDAATVARFYREARAAASLKHANIACAHDVDQDGTLHFLVMEYIDGSSLYEIVKKHGKLDVQRACHYIRQAAVGLQHIHEARLVHRDIKPGNLMLDRTGTVKILDLGLARFFGNENKDSLTEQFDKHSMMGTADYLAPEQAVNPHEVDIRADIYSLGATFYYLLAGRPPFSGKSVTQKIIFHQMKEPDPITQVREDVSPELAEVLARMLKKPVSERFQTPSEVVDALAPFTEAPILPPPVEEMPKLCAAAQSNTSAEDDVIAPLAQEPTGTAPGESPSTNTRIRDRGNRTMTPRKLVPHANDSQLQLAVSSQTSMETAVNMSAAADTAVKAESLQEQPAPPPALTQGPAPVAAGLSVQVIRGTLPIPNWAFTVAMSFLAAVFGGLLVYLLIRLDRNAITPVERPVPASTAPDSQ